MLHGEAHRASMISAIQQKPLEQRRVAGDGARRSPGAFDRFDRLVKTTGCEAVAAQPLRRLEPAERRRGSSG